MEAEDERLEDVDLAELVAFADGSLPPQQRSRIAARIQREPRLRELVDQQRAAVAAIAALDTPAPARLRAGVVADWPRPDDRSHRRSSSRFRRPRMLIAAGLATAAAVGLALVIVGGSSSPSVGDTVDLATAGPTAPPPAVDASHRRTLVASVGGNAFPNYAPRLGWRRAGAREDELDGRLAKTVYYRRDGVQVAYTIVGGEPLSWPAGVRVIDRRNLELRSLDYEGSAVVTWLRNGHTCVLSSDGATRRQMLKMATWEGGSAAATGRS
jgi:hypothetical protein